MLDRSDTYKVQMNGIYFNGHIQGHGYFYQEGTVISMVRVDLAPANSLTVAVASPLSWAYSCLGPVWE